MCESIYDELNANQQLAFREYKNSSYILNSFLLGMPQEIPLDETDVQNKMNILDSILAGRVIETNVTLYRATDDAYLLSRIQNDILEYPAYLSTCSDIPSLERHYSGTFFGRPTVLIINCAAGANMVCLDAPLFGEPENELLLGRDLRFQIIRNDVSTEREVINQYMGTFYSEGIGEIRILEVNLLA